MTPQKDVDTLDEVNQQPLFPSLKQTPIPFKHQLIAELHSIQPIKPHTGVFNYYQDAGQSQPQSSAFSLHSNTNETLKHRPRKTLTKDLIRQLNEAFQFYEQQPSSSRYYLTDLANVFRIGYSTILRKYKEFRSHSYIQEGKRLTAYPKSYKKRRLAHIVISRSLAEKNFSSAKEIAKYVMQKYGLYYNPQVVRRQLRTIGIVRNQRHGIVKKNPPEYCDKCLLQSLLEIDSKIVYFSQLNVTFQNEEKGKIALLSSIFGSKLAVFGKEIQSDCISSLREYFQNYFSTGINKFWYLFIDQRTTQWNYINNRQKAVIPQYQQHSNCKIINVAASSRLTTPGDHLLNEILSTVTITELTLSEAISSLPKWLETQQASTNTFIKQAQSYLTTSPHNCPA